MYLKRGTTAYPYSGIVKIAAPSERYLYLQLMNDEEIEFDFLNKRSNAEQHFNSLLLHMAAGKPYEIPF